MSASLFHKKTLCIVTGASQGYGKCLAENFAKLVSPDSALILLARNKENLQKVADGIKDVSPQVAVIVSKFDQTDYTYCSEKYFEGILEDNHIKVEKFQQVFIIHNAGVLGDVTKYTWDLTNPDLVDKCFRVNVTGTVLFNAAVLGCMKRFKVPSIAVVNVSSSASVQAFPCGSLYCSSEYASCLISTHNTTVLVSFNRTLHLFRSSVHFALF